VALLFDCVSSDSFFICVLPLLPNLVLEGNFFKEQCCIDFASYSFDNFIQDLSAYI